jgi:N-glycosylase/DNA lyase
MNDLVKDYSVKKKDILQRLKEFSKVPFEDYFVELCYCLCTPLSNAQRVFKIINNENKEFLLNSSVEELAEFLKGHARFHNNKAVYIYNARNKKELLLDLPKNNVKARNLLVKEFKGLGLKEASHFLRNIGYRNIGIIDGHIINSLEEFEITNHRSRPSNEIQYELMEKYMQEFAKKVNIDMDELDLLLWARKTGVILK